VPHFDTDHVLRQLAAGIPKIDLEGERVAPRLRRGKEGAGGGL
jgi:hypothetical protein